MSQPLHIPPLPPPPPPPPPPTFVSVPLVALSSVAPNSTVPAQFGVPVLPTVAKPVSVAPVPAVAASAVAPIVAEAAVVDRESSLGRIAAILLKVLWLPFCGIWLGAIYALVGLVQFVGLITIPLGIQSFKIASYVIWPFGRSVSKARSLSGMQTIGAVWWFVATGIYAVILQVVLGIVLCLTIVGIPVGLAAFKLIPLVAAPFGKSVGASTDTRHPYIAL